MCVHVFVSLFNWLQTCGPSWSSSLSLPNARIIGMCYHTQLRFYTVLDGFLCRSNLVLELQTVRAKIFLEILNEKFLFSKKMGIGF